MKMDEINIYNSFDAVAEKVPDNIAVKTPSGVCSYRELNAYADAVAMAMAAFKVDNNTIVGIYMTASVDYVAAVLATLKTGAVFMPILPEMPVKRVVDILNKTKPDVLVTIKALENNLHEMLRHPDIKKNPGSLMAIENDRDIQIQQTAANTAGHNAHSHIDQCFPINDASDKNGYIISTSGSTGEPKAILGSQKGLLHFLKWEMQEFGIDARHRISLLSPLTFDVSLRDIFIPLLSGGMLCIPDEATRRHPGELKQWLINNKITLVHIVPTMFRMLTQETGSPDPDKSVFPDLEYALIAGEPLFGADVNNWREYIGSYTKLVNLYGPSETTLAKCFYRIASKEYPSNSIIPLGQPIPDTALLILNNGKVCSTEEVGEIYIKTKYMSRGYFEAPLLTKSSFIKDPLSEDTDDIIYKTGDLGKTTSDGNLCFMGRADNQVKMFGNRIEIGEIEVALRNHPEIRQAAVAVKSDVFNNKRLVGYIISNNGKAPKVEPLKRFLKDRLPEYMIPAVFVTLKSLPLTHNGKVDRNALPEPDRIRPELEQVYMPPKTSFEKEITTTWCKILGVDKIGVHDNFFDLGGSSILAAKLSLILEEMLHMKIPVTHIYQFPTISYLSEALNHPQDTYRRDLNFNERARKKKDALIKQKRQRMRV